MKSILVSCILTVAISLFTLGGFACIMIYNSTVNLVYSSMTASAQVAAERAYWEMRSYTNIARELGTMSQLSDSSTSDSELSESLSVTNCRNATSSSLTGKASTATTIPTASTSRTR